MTLVKRRLIILSDLWGVEKAQWIKYYEENLSDDFDIQYYDCCQLGNIDKSDYTQDSLHQQFVAGGIDTAVNNLVGKEKHNITVLAFSVGGTIAWKAAMNGLKVDQLYCVSATRLRYETEKPNCPIKLYFGEKDNYKPAGQWFDNFNISFELIPEKGHDLYQEESSATLICKEIN